jgi:hypothetical protein
LIDASTLRLFPANVKAETRRAGDAQMRRTSRTKAAGSRRCSRAPCSALVRRIPSSRRGACRMRLRER